MPSRCCYPGGDTRLSAAVLVVLVHLATAFVADVPGAWSPRSSTSSTTSSTSCPSSSSIGPKGSSTGRNSARLCYPVTAPGRTSRSTSSSSGSSSRGRNRSPLWRSSRALTRLWIASEEQQQQQHQHQHQRRQHRRHDGGGDSSHQGSSSSSSGKVKAPVLPVVGDIKRANLDALRVRQRCREAGEEEETFVEQFRACAPYIRAHLGAVMVIHMGGEVLEDPNFMSIMDDLGLLRLLGVSDDSSSSERDWVGVHTAVNCKHSVCWC